MLLEYIRLLESIVEKEQEDDVFHAMLNSLSDYSDTQFAIEARLMETYNYPHSRNHLVAHKMFVAKLHQLKMDYEVRAIGPGCVVYFLAAWRDSHVEISDMALAAHVNRYMKTAQQTKEVNANCGSTVHKRLGHLSFVT